MRKVALLLSVGVLALTACNNPNNNTAKSAEIQPAEEQRAIGGNKDEHGCLSGAGQTWSQLQQGCVQIFNVGQRLDPIEVQSGEAVISAFILLNEDQSKLEVFLPNDKGTVILNKGDADTYQNDSLKFDAKESALYIHNNKKYQVE